MQDKQIKIKEINNTLEILNENINKETDIKKKSLLLKKKKNY